MSNPLVEIFKSLADPMRLRMVGLMVDQPRCGRELAAELELAPATISHHLRSLKKAGLLVETRDPPYVFYQLDHAALRDAVRSVTDRKKSLRNQLTNGCACGESGRSMRSFTA